MSTTLTIRSNSRRGITLLEMLLVLGLLVAIAALTMPSVNRPLENHRLRKSADLIRGEWQKARAKAMETGRTYVFRYQPEASGYQVEPWYSDEDLLESSEITGMGTGGAPTTGSSAMLFNDTPAAMKELPEDIIFITSDTGQDVRAMLDMAGAEGMQNQDSTMSSPIFFYPDGTSSTAQLLVKNPRERYVKLTLRGLTGVVYVSDLMSSEVVQ